MSDLDDKDVDLRKRWLSFTDEDEALVEEIDAVLQENLDPLIDDMYAHFLSFPETRVFFPDTPTLKRAQTAQKAYFSRMTKGTYDAQYVADRLRVGYTHHQIGLHPRWYMGAYNRILAWFRHLVREKYKDDEEKYNKTIAALGRLIFFDMDLAIEAYMTAKEKAIREQRDAIAELEAQRRASKMILEDAPVAIVQLNCDLICVECNKEFAELSTESRDILVGKSIFDIAPALPREVFEEVIALGNPYRRNAEYLQFAQTGMGYWDWTAWPIRMDDGKTIGLIATFASATDRVLLQQQREDFVATLTHDLKTPILAANRAIKLLIEGDFGAVAETQVKILETIHQSNADLYRMVQTLLDVYRYDSGAKRLSMSEQDVSKILLTLLNELQPLATSKGIQLTSDVPSAPITVVCDGDEIRRVIQNLTDNALKFTPSGGKIVMKLENVVDFVKVSVVDTGKGVSAEDRPKLFQRFWQAASSGRYYASTGLGLYLCRKIVEAHGGKIWCESVLGEGSTFAFTIKKNLQHRELADASAADEH